MRLNVFEGARRITRFLQVVWVIGCILVFFVSKPSLFLTYETAGPALPFVNANKSSCSRPDASKSLLSYDLEEGKTLWIDLCFKAKRYPNGSMRVPYNAEGWGDTPDSSDVRAYMETRAAQFMLTGDLRKSALDQWSRERRSQFWQALAAAAGGVLFIALLSRIIGWIVRGFLGIPSGKDSRQPAIQGG
jgi:hypothetical protein